MKHKILELYSGIGGMHFALNESRINGEIIAAVDVNTIANEVYSHNFPSTNLITRNIQSFTPDEINKFDIDTILMSPPCQPFTRNGKYLDQNDPRTNSFLHLIGILDQLHKLEYILMENVKGFECSAVRYQFITKLQECNFQYQEFLLCPLKIGVPNSRLRYYCLARRATSEWYFKRKEEIMETLPKEFEEPHTLEKIIEKNVPDTFVLSTKILKRANVLDIVYKDSKKSCCFTKAYTHYTDGTGSVYCEMTPEKVEKCFEEANTFEVGTEQFVEPLKELNLRFFTPKEVSSLMCFPSYFNFPDSTTTKQCYRLLGNSINVKVVSELLQLLFN